MHSIARTTTRVATGLGIAALAFLVPGSAATAAEGAQHAPSRDELSEESFGGVLLGEGVGDFPTDEQFTVMIDAEEFDVPASVELWAMPPGSGDAVLIGSGETQFDTYQNPGAETYSELEVGLIEAELPSSEVPEQQWWAFIAVDGSNGDIVTWTVYPAGVDNGAEESLTTADRDQAWPMAPGAFGENSTASSPPPTLDALTQETYGLVSIHQESAVIPLDEEFIVEVASEISALDLWLLPPGDEEATFLPHAEQLTEDGRSLEVPQYAVQVNSDDVEYNGIYALVATYDDDGVIGWTPFALSLDGESLQPGDPGVHESDAGFADRSIWPIPDSVPGPEADQSPPDEEPSPTATEAEEETPEETAPTAQSQDSGVNGWLIVLILAGVGLIVIVAVIAYLIVSRNRRAPHRN